MKFNKWTLARAAGGVLSLGSAAQAEEAQNQVLTALSATTLSGYVDTSAIWNLSSDQANLVPGRSFDGAGKQDGFNLNAVMLRLDKPLDEGQWSAGYRADLVFGPDAGYYTTASTFPGGADSEDFNVKQAYVALRAPVGNGIDLKMGVWDTLIGYEVFESPNNPNFSRSYGYFIEPTHHTGLLASYHVSDWISVSAGIANTGYGPINGRSGHDTLKSYMGSVTVTAPESTGFLAGSTLYAGIVDSGIDGGDDIVNYYVGVTAPTPVEGLALGAAWDYRTDALGNGSDEWAVALYASYQATEKLRFNGRAEYAEANDAATGIGGTGLEEVFGLTFTVDYSLWENVLTRLEARYDNADLLVPNVGGFGDGTDDDAFTLALNVVYKF